MTTKNPTQGSRSTIFLLNSSSASWEVSLAPLMVKFKLIVVEKSGSENLDVKFEILFVFEFSICHEKFVDWAKIDDIQFENPVDIKLSNISMMEDIKHVAKKKWDFKCTDKAKFSCFLPLFHYQDCDAKINIHHLSIVQFFSSEEVLLEFWWKLSSGQCWRTMRKLIVLVIKLLPFSVCHESEAKKKHRHYGPVMIALNTYLTTRILCHHSPMKNSVLHGFDNIVNFRKNSKWIFF